MLAQVSKRCTLSYTNRTFCTSTKRYAGRRSYKNNKTRMFRKKYVKQPIKSVPVQKRLPFMGFAERVEKSTISVLRSTFKGTKFVLFYLFAIIIGYVIMYYISRWYHSRKFVR